jgi:asparagine synthase (glutamine-hydrolysing)
MEGLKCALGCLSHTGSQPPIAASEDTLVTIDGSFYEKPELALEEGILTNFARTTPSKTIKLIVNEIGGFVGLIARPNRLYAFRDLNGLKPLYYARTRRLTAFASERKALWRIGLMHTHAVPPGFACTLTGSRFTNTQLAHFQRSKQRRMTFDEASSNLFKILTKAVKRITNGTGKVAVAFSGGLDSAVTAAVAKKAKVDVEGVSVGLSGSSELLTVDKLAREIPLPITVEAFSPDSIEEYVRRVLWLIEEPNLMKVSVAIPLHWAAMIAARRGCRVMLCGQGSDELFGGYYKYAKTLDSKGRRALAAELYRSVIESSQVNYERDDQAISPFGVELRTPFSDPDLIRFSLTIPSEYKVKEGNDVTRKWVLRSVAKLMGLPEEITWRRKKAIQHGTGVENAIRRVAKSQRLGTDLYLQKMHEEVMGMESMP